MLTRCAAVRPSDTAAALAVCDFTGVPGDQPLHRQRATDCAAQRAGAAPWRLSLQWAIKLDAA
ncbi:MAG: hypothetical protein KME16_28015 [Scytolyngbya sp. HA4215-MV1]|nr:hypothetical protein [Scytolyngbya sp. HA4215-MV1]